MPDEPEFLIDRSLGRKHLPAALADLGFVVHTLATVYGEDAAQRLDDETWLGDAGRNSGWYHPVLDTWFSVCWLMAIAYACSPSTSGVWRFTCGGWRSLG